MKELLNKCVEFYSMLEYFTTKNDDETTRLPTIPRKPFIELEPVTEKVTKVINDEYFGELTNINCVSLRK